MLTYDIVNNCLLKQHIEEINSLLTGFSGLKNASKKIFSNFSQFIRTNSNKHAFISDNLKRVLKLD
jgi:hypothetical protein